MERTTTTGIEDGMMTMSPGRVVHINDQVKDAVYIGRAVPRKGIRSSKWMNPYRIGAHGSRADVIAAYRRDLPRWGWIGELPELRGKPLSCWCRHDGEEKTEANACHGDVLIDLLDRYTDEQLRNGDLS